MTKIQIIIDDDKSLKAYTCDEVNMISPEPELDEFYGIRLPPHMRKLRFEADTITIDETPALVSLPDELLLRIRDYNIDVAHLDALKETYKLKEKITFLKDQARGWELRRDLAMEEWKRWNEKILKAIDKYPGIAAELCLEDGNYDAAAYFASKENNQ